MKSIGNEAYLDGSGQLYITKPGTPDPFDPPGAEAPPVITATGYTYDIVPTYGWPMSVIWDNNPLQFASQATANKMQKEMLAVYPSLTIGQSLDEVKVGPYARAAIRQISVSDGQGLIVKMNAGEMANQMARYPQGWRAQMLQTINAARNSRDRE